MAISRKESDAIALVSMMKSQASSSFDIYLQRGRDADALVSMMTSQASPSFENLIFSSREEGC